MLRDELLTMAERIERERNNDPMTKEYWRDMHAADALREAATAAEFWLEWGEYYTEGE